jgi:ubiquinone/menaquinone biosynthesis C-methylase UbiE
LGPHQSVFNEHAAEYERWFDDHPGTYAHQVRMLRKAVGTTGTGLEIGVGSGRFSVPLGFRYGIDPSRNLVSLARARGVETVMGRGEHLPFLDGQFNTILLMTVICFLPDIPAVFAEAHRVLIPQGRIIVGFIERDGQIAQKYILDPSKGTFLSSARFRSADEVSVDLQTAGFFGIETPAREKGFCVMTGLKG